MTTDDLKQQRDGHLGYGPTPASERVGWWPRVVEVTDTEVFVKLGPNDGGVLVYPRRKKA